jgi:uncharacterized protein YceK
MKARPIFLLATLVLFSGCSSLFKEPTGEKRAKLENQRAIEERSSDYATRTAEASKEMRELAKDPTTR